MRADARANRDDIVAAAKELFREQGVGVAFRSIAARAGVGVATLHRHFPTRESLIAAVADHIRESFLSVIDEHDPRWDEDPWGAWLGVVHGLAALGAAPLTASTSEFALKEGRVEEFVQLMRERDVRPIEQVLSRAAAHGYAPAGLDPYRFVAGVAIASRPLPDLTTRLLPDQQDWTLEVFIDGLRARASKT